MTTKRLGFLSLLLAATAFALVGCGGGGGGGSSGNPNPNPGDATYDMTGDWIVVIDNQTASSPDDAGADEVHLITFVQSGTTVTVPSPDGNPDFTGTVSAASYELHRSYAEDGGTTTEQLQFDLLSEDEGTGNLSWDWTDGSSASNGTADLALRRVKTPLSSLSGQWNYMLAPGVRTPPRTVSLPDQGQAAITVSGNEITFTAGGLTFEGYVTEQFAWLTRDGSEDGGEISELMRIVFADSTSGLGEVFWRWWDASDLFSGQDNLDLSRNP